ncbi:MAG: phage major capsid protein, partial [Flavonifractor plautii]
GEAAKFLWNPEGGLGNFDTQRVLNKPVLFEDSCASPGVRGDALLVDPYMYILLTKGTVKQDWSIHVEFLTDQNCFRVVYRCNGAPKVNKPLTIKNSSKTRSPFVALADRK